MTCLECTPNTARAACRAPLNAPLNEDIRVERTEHATVLSVPRELDKFTRGRRPGLLSRLAWTHFFH